MLAALGSGLRLASSATRVQNNSKCFVAHHKLRTTKAVIHRASAILAWGHGLPATMEVYWDSTNKWIFGRLNYNIETKRAVL